MPPTASPAVPTQPTRAEARMMRRRRADMIQAALGGVVAGVVLAWASIGVGAYLAVLVNS